MFGRERNARVSLGYLVVGVLLVAIVAACVPMPIPPPAPSSDALPGETATALPRVATSTLESPTPTSETPTETPVPVLPSATPTSPPPPATEAAAVAGGPPQITHPLSGREQCVTCHAVATGMVPAPEDHQDLVSDVCLFCHGPTEGEAAIPPLPEKATAEFCLGCHGPYEGLMERTASYVTEEEGLEGNPHIYVPHESTNITVCEACHNVHPLPVASPDEIAQADVQYCFSACHHTEDFSPCETCHDE